MHMSIYCIAVRRSADSDSPLGTAEAEEALNALNSLILAVGDHPFDNRPFGSNTTYLFYFFGNLLQRFLKTLAFTFFKKKKNSAESGKLRMLVICRPLPL